MSAGQHRSAHAHAAFSTANNVSHPPINPWQHTCPRAQLLYFLAAVAVVQLASSKNSLTLTNMTCTVQLHCLLIGSCKV